MDVQEAKMYTHPAYLDEDVLATLRRLLHGKGKVINLAVECRDHSRMDVAEVIKALLINDKVVSLSLDFLGRDHECVLLFADGIRASSCLKEVSFYAGFHNNSGRFDDECMEIWLRALQQNPGLSRMEFFNHCFDPTYRERLEALRERNTLGQRINRMVSSGVSDGEWDPTKCPMEFVRALLPTKFGLRMAFFDATQDRCFCLKCHKARGDRELYRRGEPEAAYVLPVSWCRFGLHVNQGMARANQVFERWHVCYHGTKFQNVSRILEGGGRLLIAGDVALGGAELRIPEGHIQKPFQRRNKFTGEVEMFDPRQIYTSPSIRYSGCTCYASAHFFDQEKAPGKYVRAQFAFVGRQRPGSYGIGQETVGAGDQRLDPHIRNEELEWYTKEGPAIMLTGLLVKVELVKR